ncbi:MAG: type IV pili methyl-accepting chemotaxis transducer N-terminal domain-containing protein [Hylemonella sp.]|nr:type IV pili methyl-accepting chemotaxis transducer N-terminal domain-containing protein [Hylemonella sp.]
MTRSAHWSLGTKLALVGLPFLLLALLSTSATLWVVWQLDGGAAAVNEAGRMRMQSYRMALTASLQHSAELDAQFNEFEGSLALLRQGDLQRPLFVPWDSTVRQRFAGIEESWRDFRRQLSAPGQTQFDRHTKQFVHDIDVFVGSIEAHISRWTAILHLMQTTIMLMALLGAIVLIYTGHLFVLEPLGRLKQAIEKIQGGNFDARVDKLSTDEFGTLADGFNNMAGHLQSMYRHLESKVAEKTAELEEKRERLENLYEVTALVARATTTEDLTHGFVAQLMRIAHADAAALRWLAPHENNFHLLASCNLPPAMQQSEQCMPLDRCACGRSPQDQAERTVNFIDSQEVAQRPCHQAGFKTVIHIPVRLHEQHMGEFDLFYHARTTPSATERSLFETLVRHLAGAMENLRLRSLETEAAVAQERNLIARELHDSIAQSLAFLKIQVQLMRDALASEDAQAVARVLEEIDAGVRESYGDVRELLLHFRTRASAEGIATALATTLRKFEHQSGITAQLAIQGQALPLAPELQIQVLHIVQEALSNVRKHAHAHHVWVEMQQHPQWRIEVRDDGVGFDCDEAPDETHVGLGIMRERAERIGALVEIFSTPLRGTSMVLTLPSPATVPPSPQAMPMTD